MRRPALFVPILVLLLYAAKMPAVEIVEAFIGGIIYELDDSKMTAVVIPQKADYYAGDIVIPDSVIYRNQAYHVTGIGDWAFAYCSNLTSIILPNSVTSIDYMAFYGCSSLTSIHLPDNLTNIETLAFDGCCGLQFIAIPDSVKSIGSNAFSSCEGLMSVHIGDLTAWCGISFGNYNSNPLAYAHHLYVEDEEITTLTIPTDVTSISDWAFYGCTELTSVTILNKIASISPSAFAGCSGLNTVVWNAKNCSDFSSSTPFSTNPVTSFEFGDSVQHIPAYLCYGLNNLTSVMIPDNVTSIGNYAFKDCSGLTSIMISDNVTNIGSQVFAGCSSLPSVTIPDNVTRIENSAFAYCSGLGSVVIGNSVDSIAEGTFYGCSSLTSVVWNATNCADFDSLITPFYNDYNLYHLDLCNQITSFAFGDNVQYIPANLCKGLTNLSSVTLPASVEAIGNNAFAMCSHMQELTIYSVVPPRIDINSFDGISRAMPVYVPTASVNAYKADPLWGQMNIIGQDADISAVENTSVDQMSRKQIINGQLFITLPNGSCYTTTGVKVE